MLRPETTKLVEENAGGKAFTALILGVTHMTPEARDTETADLLKLKFLHSKGSN